MKTQFPTRASLHAAVTHSLKNDLSRDFRRDLDKALETADSLTNPAGHFLGRYWAERAIADLVAIGCDLTVERIHESQPHYRVIWKGAQP